jgi:DnaK suppressor protein
MENDQKVKLEESIQEKLKATKKDISSYELLTKPISPDNAIGRLTRMEAINSKSINEAALKKAKDTLLKLELALAKINNPDFGLCRECEEPIPFARLTILPETDLCVRCAENISG